MPSTFIEALPALKDNYIWVLRVGADARVIVVDPGEAAPVEAWLAATGRSLAGVIVTHHHRDHTAGIAALSARHRMPVHAPSGSNLSVPFHAVTDGLEMALLDGALPLTAMTVPGHTLDAVAYVGTDFVCSGDTLFAGGCGRLFEGTAPQMHASLMRLKALPAGLQLLGGHEYALANLAFAAAVEADNPRIITASARARARLDLQLPCLPTTLQQELEVNPFLRTDQPSVRAAAEACAGHALDDAAQVFAVLRKWKDHFVVRQA